MKTLTPKLFALCLVIFVLGGTVSAQNDLNLPDVSQAAEVKQRVALTSRSPDVLATGLNRAWSAMLGDLSRELAAAKLAP